MSDIKITLGLPTRGFYAGCKAGDEIGTEIRDVKASFEERLGLFWLKAGLALGEAVRALEASEEEVQAYANNWIIGAALRKPTRDDEDDES